MVDPNFRMGQGAVSKKFFRPFEGGGGGGEGTGPLPWIYHRFESI